MSTPNRVREVREARGLSQVALAERAELSRQSVGAIEAGRAVPGVDVALRLARALEARVEELFGAPVAEPSFAVELAAGDTSGSRVALAHVGERWVGLPLGREGLRTAADALVTSTRGRRASVTALRPLSEARDNLAVMGCAVGLGVLADRLHAHAGPGRCIWLPSSSDAALRALASGTTHVAGVHAVSDCGADANVAAVRALRVPEPLVLITLARWEAGLLAREGDARLRGIEDVAARGVRLVVREKGAGARKLLEQRMREAGLSLELIRKAQLTAAGHLDVARAIAMGAADVGLATRDAALAFGLRFVPLAEERYDLVIPRALMGDARVARLLDVLASHAGRSELQALGYDVSSTGHRVAEVGAA